MSVQSRPGTLELGPSIIRTSLLLRHDHKTPRSTGVRADSVSL